MATRVPGPSSFCSKEALAFDADPWYNTSVSGNAVQAAIVSLVPVLVLWRGFRRVDERQLRRWSDRFGPVLDDETRPRIVRALRRGRRLRATGASLGILVASVPAYMNLIDPSRSSDFAGPVNGLAWVFGAALGATLAEIAFGQRPLGPQAAALDRRRWQDYVATRPVSRVVVAVVAACAGAVVAVARGTDNPGDAVAVACTAVLAGLCLAVGLRQIVRRPRLSLEAPLRVVDEALRADGAHRLAGATVAMAASSAAVALTEAVWDLVPLLGLAAPLLQWVAFGWWWFLSHDAVWRVDRASVPA